MGYPVGVPALPFLQRVEADAPGAARLYVSLDGERFTVERAVDAGRFLQLDRAAVEAGPRGALRRAELVGDAGGVLVTLPPGGLPVLSPGAQTARPFDVRFARWPHSREGASLSPSARRERPARTLTNAKV